MFRFYIEFSVLEDSIIGFKYILCLGFTTDGTPMDYFNSEFKYILCLGFTEYVKQTWIDHIVFKYILCLGFTTRKLLLSN